MRCPFPEKSCPCYLSLSLSTRGRVSSFFFLISRQWVYAGKFYRKLSLSFQWDFTLFMPNCSFAHFCPLLVLNCHCWFGWSCLFVCFFNHNALDEMGSRIDELEQSINELRTEMGQEGSPSPSAALKPKEEPRTADDSAWDHSPFDFLIRMICLAACVWLWFLV